MVLLLHRSSATDSYGLTTLFQPSGIKLRERLPIVKYPVPNLTLDYTASGALDRFGRITRQTWQTATASPASDIKHGYDRVGNRLYREDIAASNASKSFDELYAYDGMNQLKDMQRGKLSTAKTAIASGKNYAEQFTFDATGNFATYKQDAAGDGTFELNQARTHTKANEIATVAGASTYVASDRNGNMTKCVKPDSWSAAFNLVYDAWNRLVTVKDTNNTTLIAEYRYDGTNRRVLKKTYASGTLSETRLFYFNRQWQCVEEYVGTSWKTRYLWGLRYIDDLIMRDMDNTGSGSVTHRAYSLADANWNVAAMASQTGDLVERLIYSAFGKVTFYDRNMTGRPISSYYNWDRTFTGQVLDAETGLMLYRNRYYHLTLGRFVQRDPIGYGAEDENLYRYVSNTPVDYIDTLGLLCASDIIAQATANVGTGAISLGPFYPYPAFPLFSVSGNASITALSGTCCENCEEMEFVGLSISVGISGRFGTPQPGGPKGGKKKYKDNRGRIKEKPRGPWQPPKPKDRWGGDGGLRGGQLTFGGGDDSSNCPETEVNLELTVSAFAGLWYGGEVYVSTPILSTSESMFGSLTVGANEKFGIVGAGVELSLTGSITVISSLAVTGNECS